MAKNHEISQCEHAGGFTHKVGSTMYNVNIFYDTSKTESLEEKILRMMKNDLTNSSKNATISMPQADWLSERGSI